MATAIQSIVNLLFTCRIKAPVLANTLRIPIMIFFFSSGGIGIFDGFAYRMNEKNAFDLLIRNQKILENHSNWQRDNALWKNEQIFVVLSNFVCIGLAVFMYRMLCAFNAFTAVCVI